MVRERTASASATLAAGRAAARWRFEIARSTSASTTRSSASALRNEVGHTVFITTHRVARTARPALRGRRGGRSSASTFDAVLAPTRYELTAVLARGGTGDDVLDVREDLASCRTSTARARPAASSTCPTELRDRAADERTSPLEDTVPAAAPRPPARRRSRGDEPRRIWNLTWTLAADRLEAAVLRLGARLRSGR